MKLIALGSTGYHPNERRHTACYMLPELGVVLDAGTGMFRVRDQLVTETLDIFLSHAHLDHIVGLTYLLDVLHGREMRRVTVHGEAVKLQAVVEHLFSEHIFPVEPRFETRPLRQNEPVALPENGKLTFFPVKHQGGAVCFRLDWPDRSLAYVTDTTAEPGAAYIEHIRGADVLLHECNFPDGYDDLAQLTGHSCTSAVAELARQAKVGRLILIHTLPLSSEADPIGLDAARRIFPHTQIADDGLEIEF